ncbi:MAG: STAS domain-containing protein [Verrucomicrobiota bacterium]
MSIPSASIQVSAADAVACIKISGRANFNSSVDFKTLVTELRERGTKKFILDLTDCLLMDSTFLGVLTGFGLKLAESGAPPTTIELLNPSRKISDLLENLGVNYLFHASTGPNPFTAFDKAPETGADKAEVTRTCLEAHKTLMAVNPDNVPKFKDVTRFLAEDLKRIEGEQGGKPAGS